MPTKLHINIAQGIVDIEGEEEFVKSIYGDFRNELLKNFATGPATESVESVVSENDVSVKPATPKKNKGKGAGGKKSDSSKGKVASYKPKFKSNLDLAKLESFYNQFVPKNHPEKILIFATFLRDILKIALCSADDIYSCYVTLKSNTKTPGAFAQTLRDTRKGGYIDFKSLDEITVPIAGDNHFNHGLKKKTGD